MRAKAFEAAGAVVAKAFGITAWAGFERVLRTPTGQTMSCLGVWVPAGQAMNSETNESICSAESPGFSILSSGFSLNASAAKDLFALIFA